MSVSDSGAGTYATDPAKFTLHVIAPTLSDTTPPVITINGDNPATVEAGSTYTDAGATANDAVDGTVSVSSISTVNIGIVGTYSVTYTATDSHSNTATATRTVNVVDTTPPTITVVSDVTTEATGPKTSPPLGTVSATDLIDGSVAVTNDAPVGGFSVGDTIVTYIATDSHGNTATAKQTVTITDITPPTITVPGDITKEATGPKTVISLGTASATDIVDGAVTVTNDAPVDGFSVGITTVAYTATDSHGNTATGTQKITITDTTPPTIDTHANIVVDATSSSGSVVNYESPATYDLVDGAGVATCIPVSGSTFAPGDTIVTCSATDAHGNTATSTFTIGVHYKYSGILQPINADGSSIFKLSSTVPVKMQLKATNGNYITNAIAYISVAKVDNNIEGTYIEATSTAAVYIEATSTAAATTGNLFRYDSSSDQYIFNLGTKSLTKGTWRIKININDGTSNTVDISLK